MTYRRTIKLLLLLFGVVLCGQSARAQVTATATITLTVVSAPGFSFEQTAQHQNKSALTGIVSKPDAGITFRSSSNIAVQLESLNHGDEISLRQGETKTLTRDELRGVTRVRVLYLGS